MVDDFEDYYRHCGKHSGIPECCIEYFVTVWNPNFRGEMGAWNLKAIAKYRKIIDKAEKRNKFTYGYMPCPQCVKDNRRVEVKACKCTTPGGYYAKYIRKLKAKAKKRPPPKKTP